MSCWPRRLSQGCLPAVKGTDDASSPPAAPPASSLPLVGAGEACSRRLPAAAAAPASPNEAISRQPPRKFTTLEYDIRATLKDHCSWAAVMHMWTTTTDVFGLEKRKGPTAATLHVCPVSADTSSTVSVNIPLMQSG